MKKSIVLLSVLVSVAVAGVIEDSDGHETAHHHEIDHKHATSHQSFKVHHFHAVPVYVKKEDQKYLKDPIEVGGLKHKLKVLHPETQHPKGYGLTLENHGEVHHHGHHGHHSYDLGGAGSENIEQGHFEPVYHDINVHEEQEQ